jgi:anthranilate synthase component I
MTEIEFKALAHQGYNRIPLIVECMADLDTPVSLYLKLTQAGLRANSFLLESVVGGERFGRYSFIGLPSRTQLRAYADRNEVVTDGQITETHIGDPLVFLEAFQQRYIAVVPPGLPRFCGGLAGYFGYDLVQFIEPKLKKNPRATLKPDLLGTPDLLMLVVDELVVIDNLAGRLYFVVYADPKVPDSFQHAQMRLRELKTRLSSPLNEPMPEAVVSEPAIRHFAKENYLDAAAKAREYIIAGDLMQVQIGQCIQKPFAAEPMHLYRALRKVNPSPYMYYYDLGDFHIVGASPEILVREEPVDGQRKITLRPIAGTRKRGVTPEQDEALAQELSSDEKECAEHLMLIDLARNDIGRIAKIGSVKVTEKMVVEKYSHVQHLVSNVYGYLAEGHSTMDVLRATFPAGTLTGAPKVRAMEMIDELEVTKRGIYGGALGYLSYSGAMDVAIVIRTGIVKNKQLYVQAAAGIVYDSTPEAEFQETEMKARAVLRAAELVEGGLL